MNKSKIVLAVVPSLTAVVLLAIFTSIRQSKLSESQTKNVANSESIDEPATEVTTNNQSNGATSDTKSEVTTPVSKYTLLSVDANRCLGCGRCARIDSAHFSVANSYTAKVISNSNLSSSSLQSAINACPANAISLQ